MKIAIPVKENGQLDNHFGHCEYYGLYTVAEKQITNTEVLSADKGCGCKSNIATTLAEKGVTVMLAGGIGNGAINVLKNAGIEVVRGCEGKATDVLEGYVKGAVLDSGESCSHHNQEGEHQCSH